MSSDRHLIPYIERLDSAVVGCVGDIMLDHFIYGDVNRISPEAPIPVLRINSEQSMLGGLGNVVRNLGALGCSIKVFSVTGEDAAGQQVNGMLCAVPRCTAYLRTETSRKTPVKVRYIAGSQQLLRADHETTKPIGTASLGAVLEAFQSAVAACSVVVLSDYSKGMLVGSSAGEFIRIARAHAKPVLVDPKGRDYERYRGATIIKPNLKELAEATGLSVHDTAAQTFAARKLLEMTEAEYILVTRGSSGMLLVPRHSSHSEFPAIAREVFEVSGAGDTVASALAAALGSGAAISDAVGVANIAAGIVVGKVGTAIVERTEIVQEIEHQSALSVKDKILRPEEAHKRSITWKRMGLRLGLIFGSFDRASPNDFSLLADARSNCDRLVVALQSDRALAMAGAGVPVQDQRTRAYVLASMVFSDAVVLCDEQTVEKLLLALQPDVVSMADEIGLSRVWIQHWNGEVIDLTVGRSRGAAS